MNDMFSQPLVSVIMNCYNGERYLREAIDSVCAQTFDDWEIVFWDNASTDGSEKIAKAYSPRLKYYRGDHTVSLGEARNYALKEARGGYIAFLDCDDIWMPQKLELQIPLFEDPEVGLVYSDVIYFNEDGDHQRLYEMRPYYIGRCFSMLITDYCLCMQTVIIRKKALDDLGYWFDTQFDLSEERDLFTRIGYKWKYSMVNEPLAKWRIRSDSASWKRGHLFTDEIDMMLKKYSEIIPDFEVAYVRELATLRQKNVINKAMCLWRQGSNVQARRTLVPLLNKSKMAWLLIPAMLFPEPMFRRLMQPFRQTKILPSVSVK